MKILKVYKGEEQEQNELSFVTFLSVNVNSLFWRNE